MKGVLPWALLSVGLHLTLVLAVPPPQPPGTDADSFTMVFEVVAETGNGKETTRPSAGAVATTDTPLSPALRPANTAPATDEVGYVDLQPTGSESTREEPAPPDRQPEHLTVAATPPAPKEAVPEQTQEPAPEPPEEAPVALAPLEETPPAPPEREHESERQPTGMAQRAEPNDATGIAILPAPRESAPAIVGSGSAADLDADGTITDGGGPVGVASTNPVESSQRAGPVSAAGSTGLPTPDPGKSAVNLIPPSLRSGGKPRYPRIARRRGWEGVVLLWVRVDAEGRVKEVRLEHSSGHDALDQAALDSVQEWLFHPAKRGRKPVAGELLVPIRFDLVRAG